MQEFQKRRPESMFPHNFDILVHLKRWFHKASQGTEGIIGGKFFLPTKVGVDEEEEVHSFPFFMTRLLQHLENHLIVP